MFIIITIIILIMLFILLSRKGKNQSGNTSKLSWKKILLGIVLFIVLFYGYAMIVAIISMIPLYFIEVNTNTGGGDSGIWAYGLIAAIVISPILSLITTSKIIKR